MKVRRRLQRRVNLATVLKACIEGPKTITELTSVTSLTRPACQSVIDDLQELGWMTSFAAETGLGLGRPALRYGVKQEAGHVLSIDLGARHVTIIAATLSGEIIAEQTAELNPLMPSPERLDLVTDKARLLSRHYCTGPTLTCTMGVPGVIDKDTIHYFGSSEMPGWAGSNVTELASHRLDTRVFAAGDCALGASGEAWIGAARGQSNVVYLFAGQRSGAAAVIDSKVHQGYMGSAGLIGELPHLRWKELESGHYVFSTAQRQDKERRKIFESAASGDRKSQLIASAYGRALAHGAAAMILSIGPESLIIGGPYSHYAEVFLDDLRAEVERICPIVPNIRVSELGSRAVALGGIRHCLYQLRDRLDYIVTATDYFVSPQPKSLWF